MTGRNIGAKSQLTGGRARGAGAGAGATFNVLHAEYPHIAPLIRTYCL